MMRRVNDRIFRTNVQQIFRFNNTNMYHSKITDQQFKRAIDNELKEIFHMKNTSISNWIIENKVSSLRYKYSKSNIAEKQYILYSIASDYAVQHKLVHEAAKKLCTEGKDEKQIITCERNLKNILIPSYHWLFVIMGRLEHGVKFLVDLRTDVLEFMSELKLTNDYVTIQELSLTLRELLLLWFSVGFLHLERITWQSSCEILQKISDYEAIHPIRNWLDLKRRVGPYRRCYIFTHPSMPGEPLVVLHTALCDIIPDSVKNIGESEARILGNPKKGISFLEEDKLKIKAAIFYSISSTQKGLQGIELGNYLIKEVVKEITTEFPRIDQLSSLSPIPKFREWFLERIKQDERQIFTTSESKAILRGLNSENLWISMCKSLSTSLWTNNEELIKLFKQPLLRACAWYLYKEKRRNYALNNVANFHLRNGAMMWRLNWMADPSPRGVANSCGIMVNYRYFLDECETNSKRYIESYFIKVSDSIVDLAEQADKLKTR